MTLLDQELITLPEHLSSPMGFIGVRVIRNLKFSVKKFEIFFSFLLPIILSVHHWFTVPDYPSGIFKHF